MKKSIRGSLALVLVVMTGLFIGTTYAVQWMVILPTFDRLESASAVQDLDRALRVLREELDALSTAVRNEAILLGQGANGSMGEITESMALLHADPSSGLEWAVVLDRPGEFHSGRPHSPAMQELLRHWRAAHPDLEPKEADHPSGNAIHLTSAGPILAAWHRFAVPGTGGPLTGWLLAGRVPDQSFQSMLADRSGADLSIWPLQPSGYPEGLREAVAEVLHERRPAIALTPGNERSALAVAYDGKGRPALLLSARVSRSITSHGQMAAAAATCCMLAGGAAVLAVIWFLVSRRVVEPIVQLTAHVTSLGERADLSARLDLKRDDEIGRLALAFDTMIERLAESHARVIDTAHRAGMAEVATQVLHNVGNAINSANVASELVGERLERSKVAGLAKAVELLQTNRHDLGTYLSRDPQGIRLFEYLELLSHTLQDERQANLAEVERLHSALVYMREVITSQQDHASHPPLLEHLDLRQVVEAVLALNETLLKEAGIRVERQYESVAEACLCRNKLMQIVGNLVKNAIESIQEADPGERRLILRVAGRPEGFVVEITDNGVGIDRTAKDRLFTYGFTTKPQGHGFGLHYCGNAVAEMGGQIECSSEGPGLGATFRMSFPAQPCLSS